MLEIVGSRYHLPAKLAFLATHGISTFLGLLYDNTTPDLYPNNSYRKLGWAIIWILVVQSVLGVLGTVVRPVLSENWGNKEERSGFIPVSIEDSEEQAYRPSGDSGQGTEEYYSSRSPSTSSLYGDRGSANTQSFDPVHMNPARGGEKSFIKRLIDISCLGSFLFGRMPCIFNSRVVRISDFGYSLIERFLVVLGYVQLCLGIVAGSGMFVS